MNWEEEEEKEGRKRRRGSEEEEKEEKVCQKVEEKITDRKRNQGIIKKRLFSKVYFLTPNGIIED